MSTKKSPVPTKAAEPKRPANAKHAEPAIEIRAAEKTANQNTETASFQIGKIDPAAATPAPVQLPLTHDLIVEAVSDMLTRGGNEGAVNNLILSAMNHIHHRELDELFTGHTAERDRIIARRINDDFEEWKTDLRIAWRNNQRAEYPDFRAEDDHRQHPRQRAASTHLAV